MIQQDSLSPTLSTIVLFTVLPEKLFLPFSFLALFWFKVGFSE